MTARDIRVVLLSALASVPLAWSATLPAETRAETVNQVLSSLLLGMLPLLCVMLLWTETFLSEGSLVRYGANRRSFLIPIFFRTLATLTSFSLLCVVASMMILRGVHDPLLTADLSATLPVAVAASVSLGCFFAMGRAWLGRTGLVLLLIAVWILGPMDLPIAAAVPTGHVRTLLGLGEQLPLPPWGSFLTLYGMAALSAAAVTVRIPR